MTLQKSFHLEFKAPFHFYSYLLQNVIVVKKIKTATKSNNLIPLSLSKIYLWKL